MFALISDLIWNKTIQTLWSSTYLIYVSDLFSRRNGCEPTPLNQAETATSTHKVIQHIILKNTPAASVIVYSFRVGGETI